ncbi:acyl-CoA thioesterase II [Actinomadura craniellae]|uniref:Acyl-CoA thioesterase II n=1 Tax=Actinomadura craniellae TaxID=2231787 RepID=A0A365HD98_9ACTN|nr:acyl-CoA thioesterase domain-containing protein [Actinomadura craniellae]RAY17081.1 acyl-CoA thioesterase II [Actinomadura craniellae]
MTDLWNDLLACLDLHRSDDGETTTFEGSNQKLTYHRLFGGQLLAQFARAAALTCPDKGVKSLHVLFPRAGRSDEPVRYEVARHHEGGTFAALTITARQSSGVVATASVSMHSAEDGLDRQTVPPAPAVPGAEHRVRFDLLPWETRSTVDLDSPKPESPELDLWMRMPSAAPELAPALAAYATDLTLIGTALLPLDGISQRDAGTAFASAVTSHTLWFHRPFRTDGWLLLRQHGPLLAHGRGFGRGDVLTEDGSLVASYAQEAMLRFQQ